MQHSLLTKIMPLSLHGGGDFANELASYTCSPGYALPWDMHFRARAYQHSNAYIAPKFYGNSA